jgi:uncharacterized coiled-coil protein SlyX
MKLRVVQKKLQGISSEFSARLEQQSRSNNEVTEELSNKIIEVRSGADTISRKINHVINDMEMVKCDVKRTEDLQKRQGESIT